LGKKNLLEVDLGTMTSLKKDQVHVDEMRAAQKGQNITDEDSNYRLVMIGRKISEEESN